MSSSKMQNTKHPTNPELVKVDTALTVLSQVNLLVESNALAIDIGGSLAKLIYLQPDTPSKPNPKPLKIHQVDGSVATALSVHVPLLSGTLHFFAFESSNIQKLLRFIREHWAGSNPSHRHIRATGGGSFKYAQTFNDVIGVTLSRLDEMKCTVAGLNFLLTSVDNEVYTYDPPSLPTPRAFAPTLPDLARDRQFVSTTQHPFPYLLVNIGSGVSIVKVTDHDQYERISGSSLGGGTFWGLARLLLNCKTFDDIISLTNTGNNANVDMLVGDIYGGSYPSLGLDASVIAASFGKATMRENYGSRDPPSIWSRLRHGFSRAVYGTANLWLSFFSSFPIIGPIMRTLGIADEADAPPMVTTNDGEQFHPQDVALSLLRMVSYNIGQIAYLNARVHGLDRIYFGGNFVRDHPYTIADIAFAVDFWSAGKMKALFLRHDGYLGAIGAFIGASSAAPTEIIERAKYENMKREKQNALKKASKVEELDSDVTVATESSDTVSKFQTRRDLDMVPNGHSTEDVAKQAESSNDLKHVNGNVTVNIDDNDEDEDEDDDEDDDDDDVGSKESSESQYGSMKLKSSKSNHVANHNNDATKEKQLATEDQYPVARAATPEGRSISKRKRGGGAKKKANGRVARTDEAKVKTSGASVAVGSGTVVAEDELDEGEWTTVRIRRRNGNKGKAS